MLNESQIKQAAQFLLEEHDSWKPFGPFPEAFSPRSVDEAYAVQEAFMALRYERQGPLGGYKIALTTAVMQRMVGFDSPAAGVVLANTIYESPATLRGADFMRLGAECEIAIRLGADISATEAPHSRDSVIEAISALMPAFEVIEDRKADYSNLFFPWTIADNTWNAGAVLGPPVTDWREIDLVGARGTMTINDELVGEGRGSDVLGHPLEALVWLANTLAERGQGLKEGLIVMTGSVVSTRFLNPGDIATVSVEGLGTARLQVT
jgi:2-keto-4-pentenoate hydratase